MAFANTKESGLAHDVALRHRTISRRAKRRFFAKNGRKTEKRPKKLKFLSALQYDVGPIWKKIAKNSLKRFAVFKKARTFAPVFQTTVVVRQTKVHKQDGRREGMAKQEETKKVWKFFWENLVVLKKGCTFALVCRQGVSKEESVGNARTYLRID